MRKLVGSLIVAVLLHVPVAASAECAWVAWSSGFGGGEQRGVRIGPTRQFAFSQRTECLAYARARVRAATMASEKGSKVYDDPGGAQVEGANGAAYVVECLPDTIDPRGPKGGGR